MYYTKSHISPTLFFKSFSPFSTQFRFPKKDENHFQSNFLNDTTTLYIDKSKYAAQIMQEPHKLMFFHRPKKFGKTTLLSLLRHLYVSGVESPELKARFPTLDILKPDLFKGEEKLLSGWKEYKERHANTQVLPIWLDFSKNLDMLNQNYGFRQYLTEILLSNLRGLAEEIEKPALKTLLNEILSKNQGNKQEWEQVLYSLEALNKENAKLALLISEYEHPYTYISTTAKETLLKTVETDLVGFFKNIKTMSAENKFIEKIVMSGVIFLRHLNIFSEPIPFKNFSMESDYEYAFGFTKNDLLLGDPRVKQTIIRLLKKHEVIKNDNEADEKLEKYLEDLFQNYKGFCFTTFGKTTQWLITHIIPPISFNSHMNSLDIFDKGKINPYEFKNYWDPMQTVKSLSNLVGLKKNPYSFPKYLFLARNSILSVEDLMKIEEKKERELPLNLVLFKKGFFSIKRIVTDEDFIIDWTNEETKNAFFSTYVKELDFQTNFIDNILYFKVDSEKIKGVLQEFSGVLERYFRVMLLKKYELNFAMHEFTQAHKFFLEILNSAVSKNCEITFDRFKLLYDDQHTFKSDEIPNFLICSILGKKLILIEMFKKSLSQEKK